MKRLVLFLFVAVLMVGCATTYYDSEGNPVSKEKMSQLRSTAVKAIEALKQLGVAPCEIW